MSAPSPRLAPATWRGDALFALTFALAALAPALYLRAFTVDDALITARYAANLAAGHGHRLSASSPVSDGVTPLGFAHLLAPFARGGPLAAFSAAKSLGALAWLLSAAVLGLAARRTLTRTTLTPSPRAPTPAPPRASLALVPLALIATSAPLAAWSVSGMETGFVAALAGLAASFALLDRPRAAAAFAGLAAGWRPELLPWAATFGFGLFLLQRARSSPTSAGALRASPLGSPTPPPGTPPPPPREEGAALGAPGSPPDSPPALPPPPPPDRAPWAPAALAVSPFLIAAAVRVVAFGRPAPLSIYAKAPDARLGLMYAAACFLLAGPIALVAPRVLSRASPLARVLTASVAAHLAAIAFAGGDWMPLSRLMVPVLPTLACAALLLAVEAPLAATATRLALAVAGQVFVLVHVGPVAAAVGADRARVMDELRPALAPSRVVASLDIGWVGAVTDATLVDLAGVTDPAIAALPGGHTTKQIPIGLLDARRADTLVLLLAPNERVAIPWTRSRFARGVEAWLATTPGMEESFAPVAESSLPHLRYVVLRRQAPPGAPAPPPPPP